MAWGGAWCSGREGCLPRGWDAAVCQPGSGSRDRGSCGITLPGTGGSCRGDAARSRTVGGQSRADVPLLIAMLPVSVCWARFGKGLGLLIVVGLFMATYICSLLGRGGGQDSRRRAGRRIYSCRKSPSISQVVASSFGHTSKVRSQPQQGALMYSCLKTLESLCLDFP